MKIKLKALASLNEQLADAFDFIRKSLKIMKQKDGRRMKSLSHYEDKFQLSIRTGKLRGKACQTGVILAEKSSFDS